MTHYGNLVTQKTSKSKFLSLLITSLNVVVEAMASGLGVIVSRKCGAAELVEPSGSGLVCDVGDASALARMMEALLVVPEAQRFGDAARCVAEGLSLSAMTAQLVRLYEHLG